MCPGSGLLNDVWVSTDGGYVWSEIRTAGGRFPGRRGSKKTFSTIYQPFFPIKKFKLWCKTFFTQLKKFVSCARFGFIIFEEDEHEDASNDDRHQADKISNAIQQNKIDDRRFQTQSKRNSYDVNSRDPRAAVARQMEIAKGDPIAAPRQLNQSTMLIFGGWTHRGKVSNDGWISQNGGEYWRPAASSSAWAPRELFREIIFEGCQGRPEIFLSGGRDERGNQLSDCFKSDEHCHSWHGVACRGVAPAVADKRISRASTRLSKKLETGSDGPSSPQPKRRASSPQPKRRPSLINRSSMSMATGSGIRKQSTLTLLDESPTRKSLVAAPSFEDDEHHDPDPHVFHFQFQCIFQKSTTMNEFWF